MHIHTHTEAHITNPCERIPCELKAREKKYEKQPRAEKNEKTLTFT